MLYTLPLTKMSYTNSLPKYKTTLKKIITTPPFCHEWQKESNSGSHLIIARRASILVLSIIITTEAIITLILWSRLRWSIHAHKLYHDGLKSHFTCWRRRSGGGCSERSWKSHHLGLWPPWKPTGPPFGKEEFHLWLWGYSLSCCRIRNEGLLGMPPS